MACIVELVAAYLVGCKIRCGFLIFILCNVLWIFVAIHSGLNGMVTMMFAFLVMNVRNYVKWGRNSDVNKR